MKNKNFGSDFKDIISVIKTKSDVKEIKLYLAEIKRDIQLEAFELGKDSSIERYQIDERINIRLKVLEFVLQFLESVTNDFTDTIVPQDVAQFEHFNLNLNKIQKFFIKLEDENIRLLYVYYLYLFYQIQTNCAELGILQEHDNNELSNLLNFINPNLSYLREKRRILIESKTNQTSSELEDADLESEGEIPDIKTEKIATNMKLQVLVLKYMLTALNYDQDTNRTEIARFISFTTGKSYKNVYDYVLKVFKFVDSEQQYYPFSENLLKIEKQFRKVGLNDLAAIVKLDRNLSLFHEEETLKNKLLKR